ncbi:MAG: hypothetical protein KGY61_12360 [Desulfobacterales bacterium]|nr:hypothetical protein [Desulfobacterales bacterium]
MKYTNKDIIRSGERKLIRFIAKHLDLDAVKESIRESYQIDINDHLEHKSGNIEVHNEAIAYRLDFDVKIGLSVLLNRNGEPLSIDSPQLSPRQPPELQPEDKPKKAENSQKASEIAQMIEEINK